MEHNGYLYLNCPENGIYVFDMFGTFSRVISLRQLREFRVNETILYFQRDSLLCSYDYKLFEEVCKSTKEANLKSDVKYINGITYKAFRDSLVVLKPWGAGSKGVNFNKNLKPEWLVLFIFV